MTIIEVKEDKERAMMFDRTPKYKLEYCIGWFSKEGC